MSQINLEQIISIISKSTGIPEKNLNIDSESCDFDNWDSLSQVRISLEVEKVIKKKIQRAVTDSGRKVKVDKSRPGISNLVQLYSLITDMSIKDVEDQFSGKMYSDFKFELGNVMAEFLEPIRKKYDEISKDNAYLESVLFKGAESAHYRTRRTLSKVYRKVGFIPKISGLL